MGQQRTERKGWLDSKLSRYGSQRAGELHAYQRTKKGWIRWHNTNEDKNLHDTWQALRVSDVSGPTTGTTTTGGIIQLRYYSCSCLFFHIDIITFTTDVNALLLCSEFITLQ